MSALRAFSTNRYLPIGRKPVRYQLVPTNWYACHTYELVPTNWYASNTYELVPTNWYVSGTYQLVPSNWYAGLTYQLVPTSWYLPIRILCVIMGALTGVALSYVLTQCFSE